MSDQKQILKPPTFHDSKERTWTIKLTGELIDAVQAATQIDLVPDDQDFIPVINLVASHRKLGAVLWECVKAQAASLTVADGDDKPERPFARADFMAGLEGDTYALGWEALVDSIHFFIHFLSPKRAEQFLAIIEAGMKVVEAQIATTCQVIQSDTTDQALKEFVETIKVEMQSELKKELANSAANLGRSSGSTRGRFRSAS